MKNSGMILLAAIAVLASAATKTEARVRIEKELGSFASTDVDDDARGRAKLQVRNGSDGRLEVQVQKLDKRATYDVLVDGVLVGQFTTTRGGSGHIRFRSHPRTSKSHPGTSKDILLGFDPRGALLVVRDDSGHDVLAVTLADTGSVSGGDVICCVPDDSGLSGLGRNCFPENGA